MAKTVKASVETKDLERKDIVRIMGEITKRKREVSEEVSALGGYVKGQFETYDIDRTAFNFAIKLNGMDSKRRAQTFRNLMNYVHLGNLLAQFDMFDDTFKIMEEMIAENAKKPPPPRSGGDETVTTLATH